MNPNELTIVFDSCVANGSASIWARGILLASADDLTGTHGRLDILSTIARLLGSAGKRREDIRQIGLTRGPGSYTGIRIGISTVLGLRQTLDVSVFSCTVFEALTVLAGEEHDSCLAVLKAGKNEQVSQFFLRSPLDPGFEASGGMVLARNASDLDADVFTERTAFVGEKGFPENDPTGMTAFAKRLKTEFITPASTLSELAFERLTQEKGSDRFGTEIAPLYTSEFKPKRSARDV